jgi:hypothetical protein
MIAKGSNTIAVAADRLVLVAVARANAALDASHAASHAAFRRTKS